MMKFENDYNGKKAGAPDGRRVLGTNNKLKPLVGKSPASAGVQTFATKVVPPVNTAGMNSGTLLQGSGYYSKGGAKKTTAPTRVLASKPIDNTPKEETIVIHVWDEKKKLEKDFKWPK
jgi:hypothetical protein